MAVIAFRECKYSAFISYAHRDDRDWNWWVKSFAMELQMTLLSRARLMNLPMQIHLSGTNGPISGDLPSQLRDSIARSFALILVVHDHYVASGWCRQELEFFKSMFGVAGLKERLYIVALSQTAIESLTQSPEWLEWCAPTQLVWMPFYRTTESDMPIPIYKDPSPDSISGIVSQAFWEPFVRLREDLVKKIKANVTASLQPSPPPEDDFVRIYIESSSREGDRLEALAAEIKRHWDRITNDLDIAPPLYLRPTGLPIDEIDKHPQLADADGVILLWGMKTPESLVAQICKVERKLPSGLPAPSIVAHLTPPQIPSAQPLPAWHWNVLRFRVSDDGHIGVDSDEAALEGFLRKAIEHKRRRRQSQLTSANA